jgi:hypothetical protein
MPEPNEPAAVDSRKAELDQAQSAVRDAVAGGGTPTRVELKSGEVFEAPSPELLIQKLAEAKQHATEFIDTLKSENAELRPYKEKWQAFEKTFSAPAPQSSPEFDSAKYYTLLNENPVAANQYLLEHTPEWKELREFKEQQRLMQVAAVFGSQNPDFPNSPEASNTLLDIATKTFGLTTAQITPETLSAAYLFGKSQGQFKASEGAGKPDAGITPPPNLPSAPPTVDDASAQLAERIANAPNVAEAEKILHEAGLR